MPNLVMCCKADVYSDAIILFGKNVSGFEII